MYAGAEADNASITSQAEDESWIKVELYVISRLQRLVSRPLVQLQASSAPQVHEAQHERNASQPTSAQQIARRRVWRLSTLLVPMHPQFHHRYPRKRKSPLASHRTLDRVRPQPPEWLGRGTTDQDAACGCLRRLDPRHGRGSCADPVCHGRRSESPRLRSKRTCSRCPLGACPSRFGKRSRSVHPLCPRILPAASWSPMQAVARSISAPTQSEAQTPLSSKKSRHQIVSPSLLKMLFID